MNKFIVIVSLASLAACGKKDSSSSSYSCTLPNVGACYDFGSGYTSSTAATSCTSSSGTFASAACSTADRVGSCEVTSSGFTLTTRFYSTGTAGFNATTAAAACTGTFTP